MPRLFDAWNFVKSLTTWPLLVAALLIGGIIGAVLARRFFSDDDEA